MEGAAQGPSGADPRRGLLRQGHADLVQQKLVLLVRTGVARQDEVPAVGGRQMDIHHLDGGERLDDGARCEAVGAWAGEVLQRHQQAVGDEGDKDVRLDPLLALVEDRPDREVVLELLERLLNFGQLNIQAPERGRVFGDHVGSQQITALATAYPAQPVAPQAE